MFAGDVTGQTDTYTTTVNVNWAGLILTTVLIIAAAVLVARWLRGHPGAPRMWTVWVAVAGTAINAVVAFRLHDGPWRWMDALIGLAFIGLTFALTLLVLNIVVAFVDGLRDSSRA
jgi:hypothetical protein